MTSLSWIGVNPAQHKLIIAILVVLVAAIIILTPKIEKTCMLLLYFTCAFLRELRSYFVAWLKGVKKQILTSVKMVLYTKRREWLDETEMRITE